MSEHLGVKGKVDYYHLPMGDEYGITYCLRCKDSCEEAIFEIHQGIEGYWLKFICGHCKKTIWTAGLFDKSSFEGYGDSKFTLSEVSEEFSEKLVKRVVDDKICCICKKPTNYHDAVLHSMSSDNPKLFSKDVIYGEDEVHVCSEKCLKEYKKVKECGPNPK